MSVILFSSSPTSAPRPVEPKVHAEQALYHHPQPQSAHPSPRPLRCWVQIQTLGCAVLLRYISLIGFIVDT